MMDKYYYNLLLMASKHVDESSSGVDSANVKFIVKKKKPKTKCIQNFIIPNYSPLLK